MNRVSEGRTEGTNERAQLRLMSTATTAKPLSASPTAVPGSPARPLCLTFHLSPSGRCFPDPSTTGPMAPSQRPVPPHSAGFTPDNQGMTQRRHRAKISKSRRKANQREWFLKGRGCEPKRQQSMGGTGVGGAAGTGSGGVPGGALWEQGLRATRNVRFGSDSLIFEY